MAAPDWIQLTRGGSVVAYILPPAAASVSERLFNRDLSWLAFNDRVLSEADDTAVPALERLRFCAIVSSNLDEFFAVRVGEIAQRARRSPGRLFPDGLTAAQTLSMIREAALKQKGRQALVLSNILDALEKEGVVILRDFNATGAADREIRRKLPEVRCVLRRSSDPVPSLPSERIHVFVRFAAAEYAICTIEDREARLIELSPAAGGQRRYALAERWLSDRAAELFPGREVVEAFPFKIIREADLRYRPEEEDTLEEQIAMAVSRRSRAKVVRLEIDAPMYSDGALFLATSLGLSSASLYRFDLPLDLRTLSLLYNVPKPALKYPPIKPQVPPPLARPKKLAVIAKHDILLHHPYDSFDVVVQFLREAARDPKVTRVYHTMYRTSRESPIMDALKEAVRRGKKVTAYVEIKARFDELNNLRWAEDLRRAGVRVVRPMGGYKVHSKVTQIFRREGRQEVSYLHLGTGNYHPGTARQYTDLGLLTSDQDLGWEVAAYFRALTRRAGRPFRFRELLVAPSNLHQQLVRLIRAETRHQREGGQGRIMAKMNALVDREIIEALYAASQAGVKVDLLVRGICCLKPGVPGLSDNIRVVSIVDRFLEHSRVFYFRAGGEEKLFLSSADWMPRNFYTRFELAFPIKDKALMRYVRDVILKKGLEDNVKASRLGPDGAYTRVERRPGDPEVRSQFLFEALAADAYRDTALKGRVPTASLAARRRRGPGT